MAAASGATAPPLLTAADHDQLRRTCQTGLELVKAVVEVPDSRRMFVPPPNSQLCHSMAFNYSYFFQGHAITPELLKRALQTLAGELPHLAGRGRVLGSGSRVADCAIECNNEGIELATASAPQVRLQDVGPHTWSVLTCGYPLESTPLPFYAQPPSHTAATKGLEPPLRIRLTNLADGQVLSASFWHILADAGRGVKLLDRLSEHYRAAAAGRPVGSEGALTSDTRLFHSPADLMEAMATEPPKGWASEHRANDKMTPWQWATAPWKMVQWGRRRYDVHLMYLPSPLLRRIKQAITQESGGVCVSTNDAVQGVLFALCSDMRGRPLVPPPGQFATTNSDLLHGLSLKDPSLQQRYFGNAVQALKPSSTAEDGAWQHKATEEERFVAAAATNARLIRQAITDFRKDVRGTLDALDELDQMASMHKLRLAANWVVKLGDLKTSAASSMAKFPLHTADFGAGGPLYMQCEMVPWYDWWSLVMPAAGIDDGQGLLVRTVMGEGLGPKLAQHHVWRRGGLLHGAQLRLAGQPAAPLGGSGEHHQMEEVAATQKKAPAGRRAEVWDEEAKPAAAASKKKSPDTHFADACLEATHEASVWML
ncbi:hypothetical protein COHA_000118 [Chlorella ohadii]|uniref:Uncharacterized protein n=1 Tax=Chlorella ohadii TaxID=2649997 RepID=A0AAD5H9A6_9CHLO|nr:hypothetical protein COHA_000118 [Chlorella ohadii]